MCRSKRKQKSELGAIIETQDLGNGNFCYLRSVNAGKKKYKTLPHTAYDSYRGWSTCKPQGHPELTVRAQLCTDGYIQCGLQAPRFQNKIIEVKSLPDTGAQLTVTGLKFIHSLGIRKSELIPLSHGVNAANNAGLGLLGGAFISFKGVAKNGVHRETKQLCYVASDIEGVYLSRSACIDLGLIHKHFPAVGQFAEDNTESFIDYDVNNKDDSMYQSIYSIQGKQCNCPRRV